MGYGTARRVPLGWCGGTRSRGPSREAAGEFPADALLFTGPRGARRRVGWVEPSGLAFGKPKDRLRETHRRGRGLMGFARAQPILRFLRAAPHGPPSRGCAVFSLLFTRRRALKREFVAAPGA